MTQRICRVLFISATFFHSAFGQEDSLSITDPYLFSIEKDVLNLKVKSTELREVFAASRSGEDLSETVTSTYIITAEEIRQSGVINLEEALRLAPSTLVRQKTNGYFDVSIRGASGAINHQGAASFENASVLLTIDGIPLNNWFQGSILWETIPVALNDIQQIEVIATPNTVFFGPNAATGLINIVTKDVEEKVLQANLRLQGGISEDYSHQGSASFGISDQLKFRIAGHYNRLTRAQDDYYILSEQRYIQSDSLLYYQATARETNPSAEKALRNTGINAFATYQPSSQLSIDMMVGTKESYLQSLLHPVDRIALTNRDSKTSIVALHSQFRNVHTKVAYQSGAHNVAVGYAGFEMRTENLYTSAEYDYSRSVYQAKVGGDINYNVFRNTLPKGSENLIADTSPEHTVLLGTTRLYNMGLFVNQRLRLFNGRWHWLAAVRGDRFSITDQFYGSYQFGSTYRIGKRHLIRAVTSYGLGNFSAQNFLYYDDNSTDYLINQNLRPFKVRTYEAGYEVTPYSDLRIGIAYFYTISSDFADSLFITSGKMTNSDISTIQRGLTVDMQWSINKLKLSAFLTVQNTSTITEAERITDLSVPGYIGGLTGNYRTFLNKLRFNAGIYYYGGSTLTRPGPDFALAGKVITNCRVSYNVWDEHTIFFNGRNILNNSKMEVPYADQAKNLYLIGIDLVF